MRTHYTDTRLFVNAGIHIPACVAARPGPLDTDASRWPQTRVAERLTCKHCMRALAKLHAPRAAR